MSNSIFRRGVYLAAGSMLVVAGCRAQPVTASDPDRAALVGAPETVTVAGRVYRLETYLWRNFMPGTAVDSKGLMVLVWLTPKAGRRPVPDTLDLERLWVVRGETVWATSFSNEPRAVLPERQHQLEKIARGGPRWPPGARVEVVVRVVDRRNGQRRLLRVSAQPIHHVM